MFTISPRFLWGVSDIENVENDGTGLETLPTSSNQDVAHDVTVHVGKPIVAAGVAEGELLVIES